MKFIAIIIALFLGLTVSYGQTGEISGKVLDKEDNSPIAVVFRLVCLRL